MAVDLYLPAIAIAQALPDGRQAGRRAGHPHGIMGWWVAKIEY